MFRSFLIAIYLPAIYFNSKWFLSESSLVISLMCLLTLIYLKRVCKAKKLWEFQSKFRAKPVVENQKNIFKNLSLTYRDCGEGRDWGIHFKFPMISYMITDKSSVNYLSSDKQNVKQSLAKVYVRASVKLALHQTVYIEKIHYSDI